MVSTPQLSVIVPSVNGWSDLAGCLEALEALRSEADLEVLVIDRCGSEVREEVARRFPNARVFPVSKETTIPQMRALGFANATGNSVAVIEDHVIVPRGWAKAMLAAQTQDSPVIGGSVENGATTRLVDVAAFLCEYSHCMPPLPSGNVLWLTGNNVVYPRELLRRYQSVIDRGGWENLLHEAFRHDGIPLVCRPEIQVSHKKHYTVGEYVSQRYLYSRSYAGVRFPNASLPARMARSAAALALPPLLLWRTVSRIMAKGRYRAELVRSMPLLLVFVTAWAAGEVVGYLAGPGDSLAKVC